MNPEQLLKPRYRVIADYPENNDFPNGEIIDKFTPWESCSTYWEYRVTDCKGTRTWLAHFFDEYPHIFKKLEWFEEREEKDMPNYIKVMEEDEWEYFKVDKWVMDGCFTRPADWGVFGLLRFKKSIPTTEQEYNDYKNSSNE